MTMSTGPGSDKPDANVAAGQSEVPQAAEPSPNPNQPSGTSDASSLSSAPLGDGAAETPDSKDKNKIFETVRLKARLTMAEQELERVKADLEQLRAAPAEYQDKNIRLLAEMENLRRRTERERSDTAKFAITRFARDVLTVADNVQRAIDTAPLEAKADDGPIKSFFDGVMLTGRELLNVLERHGVKRIDPTGERFDPNVHQAMMQADNLDVPAGTVIQTFQPAYMIEDRVLRPAMVVVSRGGPKLAKASADGGDGAEATGAIPADDARATGAHAGHASDPLGDVPPGGGGTI